MANLTRELTPGYDPYSHNPYQQTGVVEWTSFCNDIFWIGADGRLNRLRATTDVPRETRAPQTTPEPREPDNCRMVWML